jgi:hypothetical protein
MLRIALLAAVALLAACTTAPPVAVTPPPAPPPAGMERLLGQPVSTALQLLGPARLDKREGTARQLQFSGSCILDLWYYPRENSVPLATHAEARLPDGRSIAPGACLRQLMPAPSPASPPTPTNRAAPARPGR